MPPEEIRRRRYLVGYGIIPRTKKNDSLPKLRSIFYKVPAKAVVPSKSGKSRGGKRRVLKNSPRRRAAVNQ